MTNKVTKESLAENIGRLESYGEISLSEEYQLKAYRQHLDILCTDSQVQIQMLIEALDNQTMLAVRWEKRARESGWAEAPAQQHEHNWIQVRELGMEKPFDLCECGATRAPCEDDQHAHLCD